MQAQEARDCVWHCSVHLWTPLWKQWLHWLQEGDWVKKRYLHAHQSKYLLWHVSILYSFRGEIIPCPQHTFWFHYLQKDMVVKNVGQALRYCLPQMVGQKIGNFWVMFKLYICILHVIVLKYFRNWSNHSLTSNTRWFIKCNFLMLILAEVINILVLIPSWYYQHDPAWFFQKYSTYIF